MKRSALQNKQVVILRMAFRARKVLGTFEKRTPGHHIADTGIHILVRFSSNFVAIFMLCSEVVRLKRKGNYIKLIEIVISSIVRS